MIQPENDIHPSMDTKHHAAPHNTDGRFSGHGHEFTPISAVAHECRRLGRSIYDRHAVYAQMQRECHPEVICKS
jgi:hypothetical protein